MKQWSLVWRLLRREGFKGELRWFVLALALSVASLVSVALVADRLQAGLNASGRDFLGADSVLRSGHAVPPLWLAKAQAQGLQVQSTVSFNSMLFYQDKLQLAAIRSVPSDFPFYGQLKLAPQHPVKAGEIWLSARLMALLEAKVGAKIEVGDTQLFVAGELQEEPDQGFNSFLLAPKALIHSDDLAATGALLPGSRQQWRYLFKGPELALKSYQAWLSSQLAVGQKWLTPAQGESQVSRALATSERFFRLASLAGVLLGALAMGIAMRHFAARQTSMVALMKTLGASRRTLMQLMGSLLGVLTFLGALFGCVVGFGIQALVLQTLGELLPANLPPPSWRPFVFGIAVAFFITLLLALVPFVRLLSVPPLRVLRREMEAAIPAWLGVPVVLIGLYGLMALFTGDSVLAAGLLTGMVLLMTLLATLLFVILRLAKGIKGPHALQLAVAHLARERSAGLFQLAGFALALMLFGLLWAVRIDLQSQFSAQLPADTPNRFLLNVTSDERLAMVSALREGGAQVGDFYPMVQGRLTHIGQDEVGEGARSGREGVDRELNLTTSVAIPTDNQLVAGRWLSGAQEVSVDKDLAARLGIKLGDTLRLTVEGSEVSATVTSLRAIKWDNMRPNFYLIFSSDVLAPFAKNWLGSYRLDKLSKGAELALLRQYPTVSLIDIDDLVVRLTKLTQQVSQALMLMLALVTLAALLVLLSQTQASMVQRQRELLLMRTLGASRVLLSNMLRWQLVAMGLLAGLCAAFAVELASFWLQWRWFDGLWQWHSQIWLVLLLLGAFLVSVAGIVMQRSLLTGTLNERLRGQGQGVL